MARIPQNIYYDKLKSMSLEEALQDIRRMMMDNTKSFLCLEMPANLYEALDYLLEKYKDEKNS